jgi:hypothetical protein
MRAVRSIFLDAEERANEPTSQLAAPVLEGLPACRGEDIGWRNGMESSRPV